MPITPAISISQSVGQPSKMTVTDASTGSDPAITQRRVFQRTASGAFLVPEGTTTEYTQWPYASSSITLDDLDKDYGLAVIVQWLDGSDTVLYDKTVYCGLTLYNETFDYQLTQMLSGNPLLINDNSFFEKKSELRTNIDSGNQAIALAADIFGAQQCYDRATNLRINFF